MSHVLPRCALAFFLTVVLALGAAPAMAQSGPAGEVVMAWHVTLAPTWLDPSTAPPQITPFGMYSKGSYAYGGYPDIDDMFQQQARERDPKKREALLGKIQQLTIDRVMFAPIMDFRALMGVGPKITEHTITWIHNSPFPSYEDVKIK